MLGVGRGGSFYPRRQRKCFLKITACPQVSGKQVEIMNEKVVMEATGLSTERSEHNFLSFLEFFF